MTDTPHNLGILYGIGVGPGDPDLITVKALKILERVPSIFAAASPKNDYSIAENIVRSHLPSTAIEHLAFPMTREKIILESAWQANADRLLEVLQTGRDAAFLTLGDPMTYSTFSYLLKTVRNTAPDLRVVTVPGITSYHAAAAASSTPLAEGEESLHLISGAKGGDNLRKIIETSENVVMLKTYKHFDDIYETLEDLDLLDKALCVSRCGLENEMSIKDVSALKGEQMPYLSLVIIKKKGLNG